MLNSGLTIPSSQSDCSFDAFDNAQVTIGSLPEYAKCLLIPRTVMRGDRLCDAIKLNEDDALIKPTFIDARRQPARQKAAACRVKCRAGELCIRSESLLIAYGAVRANPICFGHSFWGVGHDEPGEI